MLKFAWLLGGLLVLALTVIAADSGDPPKLNARQKGESPEEVATTPGVASDREVAKEIESPEGITSRQEFTGLIMPKVVVSLSASPDGIIKETNVNVADKVRTGDIVVVLENRVERFNLEVARKRALSRAEIKEAEARRDLAKQQLDRQLYLRGSRPESELEEARANLKVAEAKLEAAHANLEIAESERDRAAAFLDLRTIRSPMNGVVTERFLSPGESTESGPILELAQVDPLIVEIMAAEGHWDQISKGASAIVQLRNGEERSAEVTGIDPFINPASGDFRIRLELKNPEEDILAGQECRVIFE